MSTAALGEATHPFEAPVLSQACLQSTDLQAPGRPSDLDATRQAPAAHPVSAQRGTSRTITHVFEPVRDDRDEVIDFRLTFDRDDAATRPFLGLQMVRTGDWAAPGDIFHTLKRVLHSGQSLHEMTRHVGTDQEVCFYQTANRVGDTVVTTTSIVTLVR